MRHALVTSSRVSVTHANTYQGALAWGFPGPTTWVGMMTALNLRLKERGSPIQVQSVAVVVYDFQPQVAQGKFCPPRAPLDERGQVQGIQEAQGGWANLEAAFVFKVAYEGDLDLVITELMTELFFLRFAGGAMLSKRGKPSYLCLTGDRDKDHEEFMAYKRRWMLGSLLKLRTELIQEHQACLSQELGTAASKLEAWYDLFTIRVRDDSETMTRAYGGWLVPVTTGYQGVSPVYPPGTVQGVRDQGVPFHFVESIWDVGEWVSPSRLESTDAVFCRPEYDPVTGTYRCLMETCHV